MIKILGVKIDNERREEVRRRLEAFCADASIQKIVVTPNPEMLVDARRDPEFKAVLNAADLSVPDGQGLVFVARLLGIGKIPHRVTGNEVLDTLFRIATQQHLSVYLLGGAGKQAVIAAERVRQRFRGITVFANPGGPIWFEDTWHVAESVLADIRQKQPAILAVALGHGKQEKFMKHFLPSFPSVRVAVGIGGAFSFLSGEIQRAPKFFQDAGLEWLWRLWREPSRYRRIFKATAVFPVMAIWDKILKQK